MNFFHNSTIITIITPIFLILLLGQTVTSQPSPPWPDSEQHEPNFSPSMGVIIIVLVAALFFMGFFSIYIRHCSNDTSTNGRTGRGIGSLRRSRRAPRGLNPEVIESFPTFDYAAVKSEKLGKGALECAVCLTEFEDDDTLRLIPKCDHVFHPECIDAWLVGHTTCPVCRCNLSDASTTVVGGEPPHEASIHSVDLELGVVETENSNNEDERNDNNNNESMEQPLHGRTISRNRTIRNLSFGRPRWLGKHARSMSTGHVSVKQWDDMERFTLRLPQEVRKQIMSRRLERTTSLLVLPRETSSRRGYRTGLGYGEGSNRGRFGSTRSGTSQSDRWVFSLAPPFITRAPSVKSPKVVATTTSGTSTTTSRGGSLRGNVQNELNQLPI